MECFVLWRKVIIQTALGFNGINFKKHRSTLRIKTIHSVKPVFLLKQIGIRKISKEKMFWKWEAVLGGLHKLFLIIPRRDFIAWIIQVLFLPIIRNNGHHGERLKLFQASVYELPFPDNTFDKVFCFGVLQHTPDFKKSVKCLIDKAKPGAEVVVDFYPINGWWTKLHAKYIFRPLTKKMSHEKLLSTIERNIDWLMKLYFFFDKVGVGRFVNRFLPICDIKGTLPKNLSKKALREWVILDTFDMFSPEHDHPQKLSTVAKWFREYGMEVTFAGVVTYGDNFRAPVVKGIKK